MPRRKAEIQRSRSGKPTSEEEAGELIAERLMEAHIRLEIAEINQRCANCGARIQQNPLAGATLHIELA